MNIHWIAFLLLGPIFSHAMESNHVWEISETWSACSVSCGLGTHHQVVLCIQKTIYGTVEQVDDQNCKSLERPKFRIVKSCFYGKCPEIDSFSYIWKVSTWSPCSRSCGTDGIRSRDVTCALNLRSRINFDVHYSNCDMSTEPSKIEKCANSDCRPEFVTTPWNKCTKVHKCRPGMRHRKLKCIVVLRNYQIRRVSSRHCYNTRKPPVEWEICLNDPSYKNNCRYRRQIAVIKTLIIMTMNTTVHQMRKVSKLRLMVGQKAFVLLHTWLVIGCQVTNYPSSRLVWQRGNMTYAYYSEKKGSRISVNKKGFLVIKKFIPVDAGSWRCVAENISASTYLSIQSPSKGWEEWIARNAYKREEKVNVILNTKYIEPVSYQWRISAWSQCSKKSTTTSFQHRRVHCEETLPSIYVEVDDVICLDQHLQKPNITKTCKYNQHFPEWSVDNSKLSKCGDHCIDIHRAQLDVPIRCIFRNTTLPDKLCDNEKKPSPGCFNRNCDVYWNVGKWSQCSKSCGSAGISARTLQCLWKMNNVYAESLCLRKSLDVPATIRQCSPPPCKLGCMDLSKFCGTKKLCQFQRYRFFCCQTCFKT